MNQIENIMALHHEAAKFRAFTGMNSPATLEADQALRDAIEKAIASSEGALQALAVQPKQEPVAWQPIETAQKDGSTVIIGRDMGDFGFVRGYGRFDGTEGEFCSGWISHGFSEYQGNLGLAHPTHWMPLPPAPDAAPHPQREWVSLNDDDIWRDDRIMAENASCGLDMSRLSALVSVIEAKLREKNGGTK